MDNNSRFKRIPSKSGISGFAAEENGRKVAINWKHLPGIYLIEASAGEEKGEEMDLNLGGAIVLANRFLDTGDLSRFQPAGSYERVVTRMLAQAEPGERPLLESWREKDLASV